MTITERTAYLKGLLKGLNIDNEKPEGQILTEIISVLDDMAADVQAVSDDVDTLNAYIEEVDEDLGNVEDYVFDDDDDDDCDCCDCDEDDCDECGEGDFYEAECPYCHEKVCFDEDVDPTDVYCPSCDKHFDSTK